MNDLEEKEAGHADAANKVHITVLYTSTAKDKKFVIESSETLRKAIDVAYDKLKESPRPGDQYFCHKEPRHDLTPYLSDTLEEMQRKGVCVRQEGRNKLEFEFDIDSDIGGAA